MKILFLSDFTPNKGLHIDESLEVLILKSDYVVFNLEGAVASELANLPKRILTFTIQELIDFCVKYGKEKFVIALANNHIFDNGTRGLTFLIEYLEKEEILFFGTKQKPNISLGGTVSILNVVTAETVATYKSKPFLNYLFYNEKNIQHQIDVLEETDKQLIFYPHWGRDMDKQEFSTYNLKLDSKKWKVFGHHPHVISGVRKDFIYSLGNTFVKHPYYYQRYAAFKYGLSVLYDTASIDYKLYLTKVTSKDNYVHDFLLSVKPFHKIPGNVESHGNSFSPTKKIVLFLLSFTGHITDYLKLVFLQLMTVFFKLKINSSKKN